MNSGYLLILGAGIYQLPLIKKAKKMGVSTLVISPLGNYPGIKFADKHLNINTKDYKKISEICKSEKVLGAITSGSDACVPTIGKLVEDFKLKGTTFEGCKNSSNKLLMKRIFKKKNIPTADYSICTNFKEAIRAADKLGYPIIIKPINSSGSRGVTKVKNKKKLFESWENAKLISNKKPIIVEKFIDGIEYGAEIFIQSKKVIKVIIHNKTITSPPLNVPIGHSLPSRTNTTINNNFDEIAERITKGFYLDNTVCNVDFIIQGNNLYILEIGARIGATCIPEIITVNTGVDIYSFLIEQALGMCPKLKPKLNQPCASILLKSDYSGFIKEIILPDNLNSDKRIVDFQLDTSKNLYVKRFTNGSHRLGHIVLKEKSSKIAESQLQRITEKIKFLYL